VPLLKIRAGRFDGIAVDRSCYEQHRLEEARTEALRAADIHMEFEAAKDVERCQKFSQRIQKELNDLVASGQSYFNCELL
jgi:hypothetical protein